MNVALISMEYPPETAYGGIATYARQATQMLAGRGHLIEVFAGTDGAEKTHCEDGIVVHRIPMHEGLFTRNVGVAFARRHEQIRFDVLEGPEFRADALEAVRLVPDIPLVVKLHTPFYLCGALGRMEQNWFGQSRTLLSAARRRVQCVFPNVPHRDLEHVHALQADEVVSPSQSLADMMTREWKLDKARVVAIPYPYTPAPAMLAIPADTINNRVTFLGRLEVRKGVVDLGRAIPLVLKQCPQAKFRFVGEAQASPDPALNMEQYLKRELSGCAASCEFVGKVPLDSIPQALAETDVCVFPSLWENFPLVCLESMSAARGVVGSRAGGMAEMLDGGKVGRLAAPRRPEEIANAVVELLQNPALRFTLGLAARQRVLDMYNVERVAALQEAGYQRAIARRKALGARRF